MAEKSSTRRNNTSSFINSVKGFEKPVEYYDTSKAGRMPIGEFGLRVQPSGKKCYILLFRMPGTSSKRSIADHPNETTDT